MLGAGLTTHETRWENGRDRARKSNQHMWKTSRSEHDYCRRGFWDAQRGETRAGTVTARLDVGDLLTQRLRPNKSALAGLSLSLLLRSRRVMRTPLPAGLPPAVAALSLP